MIDIVMLLAIVVAVVVISISLLGLAVMLKTEKDQASKLFSYLCYIAAFWVTANYLGANYKVDNFSELFIYADFFAGPLLAYAFFIFIYSFTQASDMKFSRVLTWLMPFLTIVASLGSISGIFVQVTLQQGSSDIHYTNLFIVYVAIMSTIVLAGIYLLLAAYKKSVGNKKNQLRNMIFGFVVAASFVGFANLVLPNFSQSNEINLIVGNVSYLAILYFIVTMSYSTVKYRLFDIRYVAFRLLAYVVSLSIVVVLFVLVAFNLTGIIFGGQIISQDLQVYYVLTTIAVALLYGHVKKFVDRGTNRLFFQQSYTVHSAISKISSFATRSVDPRSIQRHSLNVFEETIRPEYACFVVLGSNNKLELATAIGNCPKKSLELAGFLEMLEKIHQKITLAEDVRTSKTVAKEYFELSRIGVIARLSTNNKSIGYIILGEKKNGNNYNQHDLQLLTLASNDLALALQNALAFEEIQEFNATLQAKVNKATAALKRTNGKLVALDDTKDEFISMASHQLRTPLTSIKGYISMMLEGDLGKINPTQRKALEEAFNSSQRMVFLISDFLNVSRIRTGKFVMEKDETDLNQIVIEEITQLRELAGLRDQTINYKPPKNFPKVILDDTKTRQVMMNFIDNAIFYTPKNGKIDIVLKETDKEIIFQVTDTGIGVPKNVQHRLFTKFFRAENAQNARPDGTGLGLFMGQKIIDAQGGKMIFHSVEHEGSTFGFRFPIKTVRA